MSRSTARRKPVTVNTTSVALRALPYCRRFSMMSRSCPSCRLVYGRRLPPRTSTRVCRINPRASVPLRIGTMVSSSALSPLLATAHWKTSVFPAPQRAVSGRASTARCPTLSKIRVHVHARGSVCRSFRQSLPTPSSPTGSDSTRIRPLPISLLVVLRWMAVVRLPELRIRRLVVHAG